MTPAPRHLNYRFEGYDEAVLSFGDAKANRIILIVPPLFDEMNRVRAMLVGTMRGLAGFGVMTLLPDIPGCNESLAPISAQTISGWRGAMAAAAQSLGATHVTSIRGGALIDSDIALPHWRLASVKGGSLLKTMLRTRIASDREAGQSSSIESLMGDARNAPIDLSGYVLGAKMLAELESAEPDLSGRAYEAVLGEGIAGKPLWLRAEPMEDADMSMTLAAELDRWSASCGR